MSHLPSANHRRWSSLACALLAAWSATGCSRSDVPSLTLPTGSDGLFTNALRPLTTARAAPMASATPAPSATSLQTVHFPWRPPAASTGEYAMTEVSDQHQLLLTRGVVPGGRYPVLVALHGQPRRGQPPRDYAFARTVADVVNPMVESGELPPLVVVLPVFRYQGTNWPAFDLGAFRQEFTRVLGTNGIEVGDTYLVGHSGAAGCGGDGLNRAHLLHPAAVGFFDTCLGTGWRDEVETLRRARTPTLIIHSVETAGYVPRQKREYLTTFDFGHAYAPAGLSPSACPDLLPDKPLRPQRFRCATDATGTTRAFVVDTGDGEAGHNAVVPTALAYFLRTYLVKAGRPAL